MGTDLCFTSVFMRYDYSASDLETVPPFEECLDPEKLISEQGKGIAENQHKLVIIKLKFAKCTGK